MQMIFQTFLAPVETWSLGFDLKATNFTNSLGVYSPLLMIRYLLTPPLSLVSTLDPSYTLCSF